MRKVKPKQNTKKTKDSTLSFLVSQKGNPNNVLIRAQPLTFWIRLTNTKEMKFNLYIRGCCLGIQEGRLLPFRKFKWLKHHYRIQNKNNKNNKKKGAVISSQLFRFQDRSNKSCKKSRYNSKFLSLTNAVPCLRTSHPQSLI